MRKDETHFGDDVREPCRRARPSVGAAALLALAASPFLYEWGLTVYARWQAMVDGHWDSDEDEATFRRRAIESIESIIVRHPGEVVAAACHGGVINLYLGHILDLPPGTRGFFYPNYTSIHRVAGASSGHRTVVTINETSHLRGTGLPMGVFQQPSQ